MPRYKLTIEYDGSPFCGWQSQTGGGAVQDVLEVAIEKFCGQRLRVQAAGRTDAGVHALGQVVHVDLEQSVRADVLRDAVNAHMRPHPVSIVEASEVDETFEARFSATRRHYLYRIVNRRAPLTWDKGLAWQFAKPLDAEAMHGAAQALVGRHDFTTFRSVHCQAQSPEKTLDLLSVERVGGEVQIRAAARSFLHHQVRSMVGCLALVGMGRWREEQVGEALAARDRQALGLNAPSAGLYFVRALYPGD